MNFIFYTLILPRDKKAILETHREKTAIFTFSVHDQSVSQNSVRIEAKHGEFYFRQHGGINEGMLVSSRCILLHYLKY